MSAITAALSQIDRVAAEGDLVPEPTAALELETAGEPILLPDGKRIYPPCLHGAPVDELALALLDMDDPAAVDVPAADRPARRRQEPDRPRDRLPPLDRPRPRGHRAARRPVLRVRRAAARDRRRTSSSSATTTSRSPGAGGQVALVDSAFVQAMREGWVVMIDEVNTARDVALLSINATLDGRLTLYLAATGETVVARPGFAVLLAYNPGLVGATDIPDAWHSRFPATLEVTSNWAALAELGAPASLVDRGDAPRSPADRRRGRALLDAAVPRHRIAVADDRARRRTCRARVLRLEPPRAGAGREDPGRRGGRRLPDARPGRLRPPPGLGDQRAAEACTATRGR